MWEGQTNVSGVEMLCLILDDLNMLRDRRRQGLTVVSPETSGGTDPRLFSSLDSCDDAHHY